MVPSTEEDTRYPLECAAHLPLPASFPPRSHPGHFDDLGAHSPPHSSNEDRVCAPAAYFQHLHCETGHDAARRTPDHANGPKIPTYTRNPALATRRCAGPGSKSGETKGTVLISSLCFPPTPPKKSTTDSGHLENALALFGITFVAWSGRRRMPWGVHDFFRVGQAYDMLHALYRLQGKIPRQNKIKQLNGG